MVEAWGLFIPIFIVLGPLAMVDSLHDFYQKVGAAVLGLALVLMWIQQGFLRERIKALEDKEEPAQKQI